MIEVRDMPKLHCPFKREVIDGEALVIPEVNPGFEWVFDDPATYCLEKLDGENIAIQVEKGQVLGAWNRGKLVPTYNKNQPYVTAGLVEAYSKGYIDTLPDGLHFGEVIGPRVQENTYSLGEHIWVPFQTVVHQKLRYSSWGKYPKDYPTISAWFKEGLWSLYYMWRNGGRKILAEGVVFYHPDGRMAKLRRDMFDWYDGPRHKRRPSKRKVV